MVCVVVGRRSIFSNLRSSEDVLEVPRFVKNGMLELCSSEVDKFANFSFFRNEISH